MCAKADDNQGAALEEEGVIGNATEAGRNEQARRLIAWWLVWRARRRRSTQALNRGLGRHLVVWHLDCGQICVARRGGIAYRTRLGNARHAKAAWQGWGPRCLNDISSPALCTHSLQEKEE